ncbi:MAG: LytR/AlgR family response regulator transcription factor [Ginsengibacter sp.]
MLKTVIIENGKQDGSKMSCLLNNSCDFQIEAILGSVRQSINYFSQCRQQDIIFADVQLPDGQSFEIFTTAIINSAVVYTTIYQKSIVEAMEYSGIQYLLKPIDKIPFDKSIINHHVMSDHFLTNRHSSHKVINYLNEKKKRRMIVKKGNENILMKPEDITFFCSENKTVYAFDSFGKKYVVDKNLYELEQQLDPDIFFRINRQYILNVNFVKSYRTFEKVKLQVVLKSPTDQNHMIVSKETAPSFRKWIMGE